MRPRTFIKTLLQSCSSFEYYLAVLKAPFWFTLRFFLISYLFYGLYVGYQTATSVSSFITTNAQPVITTLSSNFPQDGYIFWSGTALEVAPDPFTITLPESVRTLFPETEVFALLTGSTGDPQELLSKHNTTAYLVLSSDKLSLRDRDSNWETTTTSAVFGEREHYVDKNNVAEVLESGKIRLFEFMPLLEKSIWIASILFITLVGIATALINGLIISLLAKIQGIALSYWKSVQLALHLLVPLEGVYLLAQRLYPTMQLQIVTIGFWILLIVFFVTQREELYKHHALKPASTPRKRN